jgi:hypothetical protein
MVGCVSEMSVKNLENSDRDLLLSYYTVIYTEELSRIMKQVCQKIRFPSRDSKLGLSVNEAGLPTITW